ncbi:MAG TPA: DUF4142 domain-containing protein [Steroidobacteraceae bacterium]|nr:DUF4142 domain-containing protein [Steroidobacteraceae bacterium]
MKRTRTAPGWIVSIAGALATAPAWSVSLSTTNPPQPLPLPQPDASATVAPLALETWAPGSASLVPLMAVDLPARRATGAESPATDTSGVVGKPVDDIGFVRQATESGRKELEAARDAQPRLKDPRLRELAGMLARDHGAANDRLSKLAESKGWPLPAPHAPAPVSAAGSSADFDARFTAAMIAGHEKSLALYRAQARNGDDRDLRRFASETLPTIEHHLAELRSLQK